MQFEEVLGRLESLIAEEREAIRRVDARRVGALADEKEALMRAISGGGLEAPPDLLGRFRSIVAALRDNGVLLVHARNCVRDVVQLATPGSTYGPSGATATANRPRRLSVSL